MEHWNGIQATVEQEKSATSIRYTYIFYSVCHNQSGSIMCYVGVNTQEEGGELCDF